MIVYRFPPQAEEEAACFTVAGQEYGGSGIAGEMMLVPSGAQPDGSFAGTVYYLNFPPDVSRVPVSAQTLVPPELAGRFTENPVCVSPHIADGALRTLLEQSTAEYGARLWLVITPYCEIYALPCPSGGGSAISRAASAILRADRAGVYTDVFCCNYCAPVPPANSVHFYDTQETIASKLELAQALVASRPGAAYNLVVCDGNVPEEGAALEKALVRALPDAQSVLHGQIDATLAVHLGPNLLGVGVQFI